MVSINYIVELHLYQIILPYSPTEKRLVNEKNLKKPKAREDRQLCNLIFCQESGCSESFIERIEFDSHMLAGIHHSLQITSAMDKVKKSFISRMKSSSQLHLPIPRDILTVSDVSLKTACEQFPIMSLFQEVGWALPIRSTFRFSYAQSCVLYKYFMEGEQTGKKMSPDQVEKLLHKDFDHHQYVTSQQIKSLFSRWARQYKAGSLKEPVETVSNQPTDEKELNSMDYNNDDGQNFENNNEDDENEFGLAIQEQVNVIIYYNRI